MEEDRPTFDGWPFIVMGGVVVIGYLVIKAVIESIRDVITSSPWVLFVPAVLFVIGTLVTVAWVGRDFVNSRAVHVTDPVITQSERTPITGSEFERQIIIRVPTSVTAVNDVIEYRFKRIRVVEVYLIQERRTSLTNVDWRSTAETGIQAEAFEIVMSERRVQILNIKLK